ncbi:MAG: sigma 54-interacting transcriptional regulator [bacterium]|nr:sigma 54-interacting transcriptional regulator [bacterium]
MEYPIINNRYKILEKLGQGAIGTVYKCEDLPTHKIVAIKLFSEVAKKLAIQRFKHEFSLIKRLQHPNISTVYDFGVTNTPETQNFFSMEYVDGINIFNVTDRLIKNKQYEPLYNLIVQVCRVLEYIHSKGLIHYDIKPGNILVKKDSTVKLLDFGLAKEITARPGLVIRGTPTYIAPEIVKGITIDGRADLYSLGCVLYEIVTRKVPFEGDGSTSFTTSSFVSILKQHLEKIPKLVDDIPSTLRTIILKLLEKEPSERYQSANEVIMEINKTSSKKYELETKETKETYVLSGKFVGRTNELKTLKTIFANRTQKGSPHIILISGETGVGKSRLLQEFKSWVQIERIVVLSGKCCEYGRLPYEGFINILSEMIHYVEPKELKQYIPYLAKLFPERFPKAENLPELPPEQEKLRLLDNLTSFIIQYPAILIIEDLQYADKETIELLEYLSRNILDTSILIFGTFGSEELHQSTSLYNAIRKLQEENYFKDGYVSDVKEITLINLNKKETSSLINSMFGKSIGITELADIVYSETKGNPLFLEETLKMLARTGVIYRAGENSSVEQAGWKVKEFKSSDMPETIKDVINKKLGVLDKKSIELLKCASIIGEEFSIELLERILKANIPEDINKLKQLSIIKEKQGIVYEFVNNKFRQVLYERISVNDKKLLHQKIGVLLEKSNIKDIGALAYHFINSGDKVKGMRYGLEAAEKAVSKYANTEAISLYQGVLSISDGLIPDRNRAEILEKIAKAYSYIGDYKKTIDNYLSAVSVLSESGRQLKKSAQQDVLNKNDMARIYMKIEKCYQNIGKYKKSEEYLNKTLRILNTKKGKELSSIFASLALLSRLKGKYDEAIKYSKDGLKMLKERDYKEKWELYHILTLVYRSKHEHSLAEKNAYHALKFARKAKNISAKIVSFNDLTVIYMLQRNHAMAIKYYKKAFRLAWETGCINSTGGLLANLGGIYLGIGNYSLSKKYLEKGLQIARRIGNNRLIVFCLINLGTLFERKNGDYLKAISYTREALTFQKKTEDGESKSLSLINLASYNLSIGRFSEGIRYAMDSLRISEKIKNPRSQVHSYITLSELYIGLLKLDKAEVLLKHALKITTKLGIKREEVLAYYCLAKCKMLQKRWKEATNYLDKALTLSLDIGEKDIKALTLLVLTKLHIEKNEFRKANEFCTEVLQIAENLGSKILSGEALYLKSKLDKQKVIEYLLSAEKIIKDTGVVELLWQIYEGIANYYKESGNLKKSITYYDKCINIFEEVCKNIGGKDFKKSYMNDSRKKEVINKMEEIKKTMQKLPTGGQAGVEQLSQQRLVRIYEIIQTVNSALNLDEILEKTIDIVIGMMNAERGLIVLVDKNTGELEVKTARNMDKQTIQDATSISTSIIRGVAGKGEPVFTKDALVDPDFKAKRSVVLNQIKSIMCVPLRIKNNIIGTVYIDTKNISDLFTGEDLNFLMAFANQVSLTIENARLKDKLLEDVEYLRGEVEKKYKYANLVGNSTKMHKIYEMIDSVSNVSSTVLIIGETGVGKEMVARAIHYSGNLKNKKFIPIPCGALPEQLLESELFGHKKGAFTGATEDKKGLFEEAEGGTLFLDDVTNLSPGIQAKLLRVLDSGEIRMVGDTKERHVNVRILAATNRDLEKEVKEGRFREDLYYRLNVIIIKIPPLRDHREDIPVLANHFLNTYCKSMGKKIKGFSQESIVLLTAYDWPGNVRELEHEIEKIVALIGKEDIITAGMISARELLKKETTQNIIPLAKLETNYIIKALKLNKGNKLKTAKDLGINRLTLHRKLKDIENDI